MYYPLHIARPECNCNLSIKMISFEHLLQLQKVEKAEGWGLGELMGQEKRGEGFI